MVRNQVVRNPTSFETVVEDQKVLDHGYVKYIDHLGSDETIIESARMSTGKGFEGWEKDAKLLEFLYKNRHTSPFEMGELIVEVQAPIMVFREWHRHRTQSYNEFSARYSAMPNLHYVPTLERIKYQATANKQGSGEAFHVDVALNWQGRWEGEQADVYDQYQEALDFGMAKEIARLNTPVSRYSKMRAKANLANWLRFLKLRLAPTAQWEIRQYAEAVANIIAGLWPRTFALFEEHDQFAKTLSRTEWAEIEKQLKELEELRGHYCE